MKDGQEVRLHTDKTTRMMGEIQKGDRIEATVNKQNHALSIRLARGTDADHETVADSPRDPDSALKSGTRADWDGTT